MHERSSIAHCIRPVRMAAFTVAVIKVGLLPFRRLESEPSSSEKQPKGFVKNGAFFGASGKITVHLSE
jgi:hypothetical protein